ncbi:B2 bradykinin receptor-like [Betta splendens]|uniref:B2 bradykinin receptor n=1 Tax=Betta splendens TaxID=158456 RepID=A0A6P7LVP0_BETSP|nr:B2 bradykinin receptor-like [Betta splendens]XP_055362262.1 B2 bradykinin receptor-like [Betta splendens]
MNASLLLPVDIEPDLCGNYTEAWLWLSALQPSSLGLISVLGSLGNALVLCVFCLHRKPCTVADVYLGNLAAADLVMMACLPFWAVTIAHNYRWDFGEVLCKLVNVAISMNYVCSVLFLTLVSVDRYLALVKPMSSSRLRRAAWAKRICLGVWSLGFLFSLPILFFRTVTYVTDPGVLACILAYPHPRWQLQHNITRNMCFVLPALVVTYCSRHIIAALNQRRAKGLPVVRGERKASYLVLAVLVVFLFCWTPHQVMRFLDTLDYFQVTPGCLWGHILDIGIQLSTYLTYSNSAINPFLFVLVGKHFRKRAKEVFSLNLWSKDTNYLSVSCTSVNRLNERVRLDQIYVNTVCHGQLL